MVLYVKTTGSHTQYCSHLTDVHFTKRISHSAACLAKEWWLGMQTVLIFSAQLGCLLKNQVVWQQARGYVARNIAILSEPNLCFSFILLRNSGFFFFFSYLLFVLIRLWFIESHSGLLRPLLGHVNFIQRLTEIATSHNPLISFYYSVGENVFETTGRKIHPIF